MRRRVTLCVMSGIAAATMVLTACGSGDGAAGGNAPGGETLRVWFPGNLSNEIEWVENELVPAFEGEHDIDVQVEFVDWGDLSTRLSTAFAGGTAPDVFGHGTAATAGFAANGRVIALDDYLADLPAEDIADMTFLDHGKIDGQQFIMPLRGFGYLLAYRTDLFEEAGLDPFASPQTWDDLRAAAEQLTVRDGDRIERAGVILPADNPTSMTQAFATFLFQAGGSFLDESGAKVTWNSPEGKEALNFLTELYAGPDAVADGLGEPTSGAGAQHPLVTGRAAMSLIDDATLKSIYEQAPDVAESIQVSAPLGEAVTASFGGAGNGLFISADSKMQDEAWAFIEFLLEPENAKAYVEVVGGIPARSSLAEDPDIAATPYLKPYVDAVAQFRGNPNVELWTQLRDILSAQVERALRGVTSADEALDASAAEATALLEQG
ncbi:ABC transporter substrate-binding protein [Jiangella aurantiaca]|nr:ABC transporter substrate-binding protein [Jiangella aurantiaca]